MIQPPKLVLAVALALSVLAAETPKGEAPKPALTDQQKLEWKDAIQRVLMAENAVFRTKEQADKEVARLNVEQQKAAQEAQAVADKLVRAACAIKPDAPVPQNSLTLDGSVKCPEKPEAKK